MLLVFGLFWGGGVVFMGMCMMGGGWGFCCMVIVVGVGFLEKFVLNWEVLVFFGDLYVFFFCFYLLCNRLYK